MIRLDPVIKIDLENLLDITIEDDPHHPFVAWLPSTQITQHRYIIFRMKRRSRCGFWHPTDSKFMRASNAKDEIERHWSRLVDKWIVNQCRTPIFLCTIDTKPTIPEILSAAYFKKGRGEHYIKEMSGS